MDRSWETAGEMFVAVCLTLMAGGCNLSGPKHPPAGKEFEQLRSESPEEVVARVDGEPIGRGEIQDY